MRSAVEDDGRARETDDGGLTMEERVKLTVLAAKSAISRRKTLWIGDLAYWMDEAYVYYAFSSVWKSLAHVKLIRNRATGLSEGYGFIEFNSRDEAEFALKTFVGQPMPGTLHGYTLNWAVPKSGASAQTSDEFERQVNEMMTTKEDAVKMYSAPTTPKQSEGSSRSVLAPRSESGSSEGSPEMEADMEDEADIQDEADIVDDGNVQTADYSVFVGDLGSDVNETILCEHFKSKCSTAHNARVVVDLKTFRPKGYGFVDFKTEKDYMTALSAFKGSRCGSSDRQMRVCNAFERKPEPVIDVTKFHDFEDMDPQNTTIFIGNLDHNVTEEHLRVVFEEFGEIAYAKATPKKGCGFVHFFDRQDATEAIENLHGSMIGSKRVRLSWGRHNATKCAIASMYQQQYPPVQSGMYMGGVMPPMVPGMVMPMTSAASVWSMYGGSMYGGMMSAVMPPQHGPGPMPPPDMPLPN